MISTKKVCLVLGAGLLSACTCMNSKNEPSAAATAPVAAPATSTSTTAPFAAVEMPVLYFDSKSAALNVASSAKLDTLAAAMQANPSLKLNLFGNADPRGNSAANEKLSADRAAAARDYLVGKGVSADRLKIVANGENQPMSKGNPNAYTSDRRVEFSLQ